MGDPDKKTWEDKGEGSESESVQEVEDARKARTSYKAKKETEKWILEAGEERSSIVKHRPLRITTSTNWSLFDTLNSGRDQVLSCAFLTHQVVQTPTPTARASFINYLSKYIL